MKYCLQLIALLAASGIVYGQPFYFRHYQVEDGLANNTVFTVFQDTRGFMWFGTKEGLNRFDGITFKAFNMPQDNRREAREFVYSIDEGMNGRLWVGTRKGLYRFDQQKETLSLLRPTRNTEILEVLSNGEGKIWFTSNLQLYCFDERTQRTRLYDFRNGKRRMISAICIAPDNTVWACSSDGCLFKYNAAKDNFDTACTPSEAGDNLKEISTISCSPDGGILIGTIRGLTHFDPVSKTFRPLLGQPLGDKPVYVRDILFISEDEYWIASESGIYSCNLKSNHPIHLVKEASNPYSISDNAVYKLYKDNEGGIWCGTYFGGINYFHNRHSTFKKYFPGSSARSLSGNAVRELCADGEGHLWIGTEDAGLNKLDLLSGNITRVQMPATNIHGLLTDGGELWVGTFQQGLDVLDIRTGKRLRHYNADPAGNGLKSNFIITFCKTRTGDILLGTSYGLYRYLRQTGRFAHVQEVPEHSYVLSVFEEEDGTVWVGTVGNGLYYFNTTTGEKGNFRNDPRNSSSLSSNSVCGIFGDSRRQLWISTEGGGVCLLAKGARSFTRFNTDSGLPGNMVYKVLEDKNNNIWISTSRGLAQYDPAAKRWKIFTKAHGLLTDQFNYNSGYRDPEGQLYFGSVKGLISFDPQSIAPDASGMPVYITSFQVNNQELPIGSAALPHSITCTDTITLAYDQSSFTLGFAALTYIAPEMTQYVYRLDGLEKKWTHLTTNRKVYFTDLSPGEYIFRIRQAGDRQHAESRLVIIIAPPFWQSPAAYFVYALLVVLLVYMIVRTYHRRQKERHRRKLALFEQEKEKEIYRAKIEFFTNVAHEIRTPLTLIKGPLEMVMDNVGEQPGIQKNLKNIEKNTERLISLTDQLLDFRSTENKGFSLSFVQANIPKLAREYFLTFAPAAEKQSLSFRIELPEKGFQAFIDVEAFYKIMGNLIGNAIKYASRQVMVQVFPPGPEDTFSITVSNDGEIIPWQFREKIFEPFFRLTATGQPGSGIGLSLARALTQLHNGTLALQQPNDIFNVFVLTLPVHQAIEFKLYATNAPDRRR
ncbi:ligand-binding sensor domain-containing protein [Chitinophaga cymbidii]|uniref:histidine kinase n=1 Tax=Chitinophaga cymbidii TaxID=1096750 RepID=A0A512RLX5_9BACT|nr:sensor histidine kinase [Chitinophaga cymbidii]GEP96707.1 hybrid sensor histidine kinase/response regulator [Chitinophaga cymbidii]